MAALGAATLDQRAALTGLHATTEAVLALTAAVVGLIRTLHDEASLAEEVAVNPWNSERKHSRGIHDETDSAQESPRKL